MDTKKCKYCNEEIAKKAKRCPKCSGKFGIPTFLKVIIVLLIILICFISCFASCTNSVSDAIDESFKEDDDINGKTSFTTGEVFENKNLKITFKSCNLDFKGYSEYADIKPGYKVVRFEFYAENIGSSTQSFDYTDFDCYADSSAMQQFYSVDDSGMDSGGTISSGKNVTVPVYCEVPSNSSKVSVEYNPMFADKTYEFIAK